MSDFCRAVQKLLWQMNSVVKYAFNLTDIFILTNLYSSSSSWHKRNKKLKISPRIDLLFFFYFELNQQVFINVCYDCIGIWIFTWVFGIYSLDRSTYIYKWTVYVDNIDEIQVSLQFGWSPYFVIDSRTVSFLCSMHAFIFFLILIYVFYS